MAPQQFNPLHRPARRAWVYQWALAACLAQAPASAGSDAEWTSLGPDGGMIFSIESTTQSPPRLIARGARQLYKSSDHGRSWQALPTSAPLGVLVGHQTVALPSDEPDTIYALSRDARLLRSDDFGVSWSELLAPNSASPTGAPTVVLNVVSVDPNDNDVVTVHGSLRTLSDPYRFGVMQWRSDDRGATWTGGMQIACRGPRQVVALETLPTVPAKTVRWTTGSTDCNWAVESAGLRITTEAGGGQFFDLHPAVFADMQFRDDHLFVLASEGVRRINLNTNEVRAISGPASAFSARSATEVYVVTASALLRTRDAGSSWDSLTFSVDGFGTLAHGRVLRTLSSDDVLLASARGMVASQNGGDVWSAARGITEMRMRALDLDPQSGVIWAVHTDPMPNSFASSPGSFRSDDGGISWRQSDLHKFAHLLRDVEVDPTTLTRPGGPRVYAAGAGCRDTFGCTATTGGLNVNGGLYLSEDGGETFVAANAGLPLSSGTPFVHIVRDITLDPHSGSGGMLRRGLFSASRDGWMPGRTSNAGASWQASSGAFNQSSGVNWSYPSQSAFDPNRTGRSYTVAAHVLFDDPGVALSGVLRSDDSGATWTQAATGLPTEIRMPALAQGSYGVTVDRSTADRVWVTTRSEEGVSDIYRSDDGGDHWYACGRIDGALFLDKIAQDPDRPSRILVSDRGSEPTLGVTHGGAVWMSDNRCLTWRRLGPALDAGAFGLEVAGGKVYAGTDSGIQTFDLPAQLDDVIFLSTFESR